jgi:hypothetical protein
MQISQFSNRLNRMITSSDLVAFSEARSSGRFPSFKTRPLKTAEITQLQKNNNFCEDWLQIEVENGFTPLNILNNIFRGKVVLPVFFGTLKTPGGISVPTGIFNCTIQDSIIENSHVQDVSLMADAIIGQGAVVRNIGNLVSGGFSSFGSGKPIHIGTESGGRSILSFPELVPELAEALILNPHLSEFKKLYEETITRFFEGNRHNCVYVAKGATLCNTNIVRNCWIGEHAKIDGADKIRSSFIQSDIENPAEIYDGVFMENTTMQKGSQAHSHCTISDSILLTQSVVGRKALVSHSIIGSFSKIEEAEITSSYVGPHVQAHHHSLLISAIWPEGRGNIGYGANAGSNHTGRMPDQEIRPGQGFYAGLGTNIRFPSNFSEAPWTTLATGITTLPQRIKFPFSLINTPSMQVSGISPALNEIYPGWNLVGNAFGLVRNVYKYQRRSSSTSKKEFFTLFNSETVKLVIDAYLKLKAPNQIREFYTGSHIEGLGQNFLRESQRHESLRAYRNFLERYALNEAFQKLEESPELLEKARRDPRKIFQGEQLKDLFKILDFPDSLHLLLRRYRKAQKEWYQAVDDSYQKDFVRGNKIFDDYDAVHKPDLQLAGFIKTQSDESQKHYNKWLRLLRS